jgi:hypothetical protein
MQRFSLGSNQYRGLRGWSAAPIVFGVRRPTPDGLDVERAQFEVIRHGLPCFVEPIHPRGRYKRTGISLVDAEDRVSHCSPEVSRATACAA